MQFISVPCLRIRAKALLRKATARGVGVSHNNPRQQRGMMVRFTMTVWGNGLIGRFIVVHEHSPIGYESSRLHRIEEIATEDSRKEKDTSPSKNSFYDLQRPEAKEDAY